MTLDVELHCSYIVFGLRGQERGQPTLDITIKAIWALGEKDMVLNDVVRARIDKRTKEEAEAVLAAMGLTVSDALRLLLIKVAREGALPFNPLIPNEETIAAMKEARAGKTIKVGSADRRLSVLNEEDRDHEEIQEGLQAPKRGFARRKSQ